MNPFTASPDATCVDTGKAWFASCPGCGARTLVCAGEESSACVTCLFQLALNEPDPAAVSSVERLDQKKASCGTLGPFELLEEIGRGGMGIIYKARRGGVSEVFAVKVLLPPREDAVEARSRFEREARAIAGLHHPYVMPVHDVFLDGDTPYFSMDYAPGGSLAEVLSKYRGRWRQAARLMVQVAEGVHHAHRQNLLHRDLKPGNILFTEDYQPLVSDFGLAKWLDDTGSALTRSLVMFGTPNYVSPEQASGKHRELTPATDIYSLGAILFELLAGRPPFVGDSPLEVLQQALAGPAPRLRSVAPLLPADLEAICARCLHTRPEDRYASAAELADDIERWLRGERVAARHFKRRLPAKFATAKRWHLAGAAAALIVAVAGTTYLTLRSWNSARRTIISPAATVPITVEVDDFSLNGELDSFSDHLSRVLIAVSDDAANVRVLPVRRLVAAPEKIAPDMDEGAKHTPPASQVILRESVRQVNSRVKVVSKIFDRDAARPLHVQVDWLPLQFSDVDLKVLQRGLLDHLITESTDRDRDAHRHGPTDIEAASFCKKAIEYLRRIDPADNDHAITLFESALKLQPDSVSALAGIADAYRMKFSWWGGNARDLELGRQHAERALTADPFSAEAHHAMGCCLLAAKHFKEAREELLQELELDSESVGGNANVGVCCRELGQPRQAVLWYRRAAQLDPVHGSFNAALGDIYMVIGDDQQAQTELRRACELDPEQHDAHNVLVILALWQGRKGEARELCRDLVARFPTNPYREQLAAEVALFCGDYPAAFAKYSQMASGDSYLEGMEFFGAINPDSAVAYLLRKQGKLDEALRRLAKARTIDERLLTKFPDNPRLLHDLAANWALEGDHERALGFLSSAVHTGWVEIRSTLLDPRFESLREDHRFTELLAQSAP